MLPSPTVPIPPEESPMLQGSETEDGPLDDWYSQTSEDSMDRGRQLMMN